MITYCYLCGGCGEREHIYRPMGKALQWMKCAHCGKRMYRDYLAECKRVTTDPELCTADYTRNCEERRDKAKVTEPVLAKSLSRVPGVPKVRGADGKLYGAFRNRQHRREVLRKAGLHD